MAVQEEPQNDSFHAALNELRLASITRKNILMNTFNRSHMQSVLAQVEEIEYMHPRGPSVRFQAIEST